MVCLYSWSYWTTWAISAEILKYRLHVARLSYLYLRRMHGLFHFLQCIMHALCLDDTLNGLPHSFQSVISNAGTARLGMLPDDTRFVFFSVFFFPCTCKSLTHEYREYGFVDTVPDDHRRAWTLVGFCTQKRTAQISLRASVSFYRISSATHEVARF